MVPSPDHPLGLLDLNERASLLRHLLKAGFQVYRLDWGRDSARCDDMALAAYVESAIGGATRAVAEHSGRSR
nr:polyhydroxyalkanoate synthase [Akkermansiaceae bacterium]